MCDCQVIFGLYCSKEISQSMYACLVNLIVCGKSNSIRNYVNVLSLKVLACIISPQEGGKIIN